LLLCFYYSTGKLGSTGGTNSRNITATAAAIEAAPSLAELVATATAAAMTRAAAATAVTTAPSSDSNVLQATAHVLASKQSE
jgi:hypothetical protein